ncbi:MULTISPECIES: hypothetical protein [Franconibacter]|nr:MULTISPECIES: hypothetical protein [Franconibacter]
MKRIIAIIIIFFAHNVWSSPYPVITSLSPWYQRTYDDGNQEWGIAITQKIIDIGTAGDVVPVKGAKVALVIKEHAHLSSDEYTMRTDARAEKWADGVSTISQEAMTIYYDGGKDVQAVTYLDTVPPSANSCVAYVYTAISGGYSGESWSDVRAPAGCLVVPPVNEWCKITTPEVLLDHGSITLRNAEGHSASASMNVDCIGDMAVSFNLITDDKYIYLDEGKSEITVDNKPLKTKINLPSGKSSVLVKDLLTGITSEGFHTGSSVLVMMPY